MSRLRLLVTAALLGAGLQQAALGDRLVVPYYPPFGYYNDPYRADQYLELGRLRRELQNQRQFVLEQERRQQQELDHLRDQAFANQRTTAEQACHYRSTGGFELCADLFPDGGGDYDRCEELVKQRNPSCNDVPLIGRERAGARPGAGGANQ